MMFWIAIAIDDRGARRIQRLGNRAIMIVASITSLYDSILILCMSKLAHANKLTQSSHDGAVEAAAVAITAARGRSITARRWRLGQQANAAHHLSIARSIAGRG